MSTVNITTGAEHGTIEVDGNDISDAVTNATVELRTGHHPQVVLNLDLPHEIHMTLDDAEIVIPPETRYALMQLGWKPPEA